MTVEEIAKHVVIEHGKRATQDDVYWIMRDMGFADPEGFIQEILTLVAGANVRVKLG